MNKIFRRLAPAFLILIFSCGAFGDDFKSVVVTLTSPFGPITVHGDQFMVIRNFTQQSSSSSTARGVVTVTKLTTGDMAEVLTAAIMDPTSSPETVNTIVIAGPSTVTATCPDPSAICFISYKKDSN
jgi:hypothetical protein